MFFENPPRPVPLAEEASLQLKSHFPKIEGSTSLGGLFLSVAQATYAHTSWDRWCTVSKTPNAYASLIGGTCDIVFAFYPSAEEMAAAEKKGVPFILTPVGREAFVFFVNAENPAEDLSQEQLRGIYSGEIVNWKTLGGRNETIIPFQRRKNSGSQSRMERFMKGRALLSPPKEYEIWDILAIISFAARYHNYRSAIGYSFLYYVQNMVSNHGVKLLRVDGQEPSLEALLDGSYPLYDDIYAVTTRNSSPASAQVIEWVRSPQGQRLVMANGFAPILPTE